ncbi:Rod shape-determining protein MreD [Euzebya pacifica]|jgi:rod shape-determining protein MreD|uniref:Rod shape-determining protein MreD n=1 Tax=Euzebya pacifica TaxID=1608957 RepID=A0A346XVG4_9ACTN|nr:rod shape-determining protein MreD [Euzebya pacifica]AXV06211.1 Rod shape-determining protein MreD [Euzebya pacifica]
MPARIVAITALIVGALLVKTIVAPTFAVAGYRPDVLVLVVVGIALLDGPDTGLRLGFGAGLAQDLLSGTGALVGLWALVLMVVGYAAGAAKPYLASSQQAGALALSGVLAAIATLGYGVLGKVFGVVEAGWNHVLAATIVVGLYTAVISPLVVRPTQAVIKQFPTSAG